MKAINRKTEAGKAISAFENVVLFLRREGVPEEYKEYFENLTSRLNSLIKKEK